MVEHGVAYEGGVLRRLLIPYVLVAIGAVVLIAIATAVATSFDGPENDGKLRADKQEDTASPDEQTREESRATSEEETTAGTSEQASKDRKANKARNKGDRRVARAGNGRRASGGQSARAARVQGSRNYGAGSSVTPPPTSDGAAEEGSSSPTNREAAQYVSGESPVEADPGASTSEEQYTPAPDYEGTPAVPDPITPTSPVDTPPGGTDDPTETAPDAPADPDEDTPPADGDLPAQEGSALELDSPEG